MDLNKPTSETTMKDALMLSVMTAALMTTVATAGTIVATLVKAKLEKQALKNTQNLLKELEES